MMAVLAVWAAAFFVLVWALQWLWNMTMPDVFNLKRIRYWQSFRLMLIATILFGLTNVTIEGLVLDTPDPQLVVTGVVTDAATGQPIEGAKVSDDGYGPKPYRGTVTGPSGTYVYVTWNEEHGVIAGVADSTFANCIVETRSAGRAAMTAINFLPECPIQIPTDVACLGCVQVIVKQRGHSQLDLGCRATPVIVEVLVLGEVDIPLSVLFCCPADI